MSETVTDREAWIEAAKQKFIESMQWMEDPETEDRKTLVICNLNGFANLLKRFPEPKPEPAPETPPNPLDRVSVEVCGQCGSRRCPKCQASSLTLMKELVARLKLLENEVFGPG